MSESPGADNLIPRPARITPGRGAALAADRPLAVAFTRAASGRLEAAVERLATTRRRVSSADPVPLRIDCAQAAPDVPRLADDESYRLDVSAGQIEVTAASEWGVLHALTTLGQLLAAGGAVPALCIEDRPRFAWRGLMLDVARHEIEFPALLRTLDAMAIFRLNVLHLHLSDDQGFRFPSERYPALVSGHHYSRTELATLVGHAADRGIRVVPELDVPGHATCWLRAYPEWGNRPAPASDRFGVHQACLDVTDPAVRRAVAELFGELSEVFPDRYLHVGGDEVHPAWWSEDPRIQGYMRDHGLADPAALQAQFNGFLHETLNSLGRTMIGWDEVLHPSLPEGVVVQAWRGATARDRALAAGHRCVMSAPYYLDLFYPADVHAGFDPAAPQEDLVDREDAQLADPRLAHVAAGMAWTRQWREDAVTLSAAAGREGLLGAEACLWSELVDSRVLDVRLWSRMPALAERFWSPLPDAPTGDLRRRLRWAWRHLPAWAGIDVTGDVRRLTREAGVRPAWSPLVDMLEPVKWYGRLLGEEAFAARLQGREMPQARPYGTQTPLNRVVDALPPESPAVWQLEATLAALDADDAAAGESLRLLAQTWRDLPADAGPQELTAPAARLSALGDLLLGVLDGAVDLHEARRRLGRAAPPQGEYLLAPVPVLAAWIEGRIARGHDGAGA